MKNLLIAVQGELREAFRSYVREGDVFISPHPAFIPSSVRQPCIGIKDGEIRRTDKPGCIQENLKISVICWKEIMKREGSLIGTAQETGIFDMADTARNALDNNLLEESGMVVTDARCVKENETDIWTGERGMLIRKILIFEYERSVFV